MENVVVLSHANDMDGIGSAAILMKKYQVKPENLFFTSYDFEDAEYAIKRIEAFSKKGINLFITDISPNKSTLHIYEKMIRNVKRYGGKVIWFDHHFWDDSAIKRIANKCDVAIVGENKNYCATEITIKKLELDTKFVREFNKMVHCSDFNLRAPNKRYFNAIKNYAMGIAYFNLQKPHEKVLKNLRLIATEISKENLFNREIVRASNTFEKLNDKRINEMLKNPYFIRERTVVGFAKDVQSTNACGRLMASTKKHIGIVVNFATGKCSIRSDGPDMSGFAEMLGGGGHPHAAGFSIKLGSYNNLKTRKDREKLVGDLGLRLRKVGIS